MTKKENTITWQAYEFINQKKGPLWFIITGLIAISLFALALLKGDFLLVVLVCLAYFTFIAYAIKSPRKVNFKLNSQGISVDEKLYPYKELKSHYLFKENGQTILSLSSKKKLAPYIKIPLNKKREEEIKKEITKHLPFKKQKPSLMDDVIKASKF